VLRYLHSLSAILFYILGGSFFVAFVLLHNGIGGRWPALWMEIGDLPLLLAGVLFGGASVVRSFQGDAPVSKILVIVIALPLLTVFGTATYLTFFP